MSALSAGLIGFSEPVLLVALIILVFGALECERFWTRSRRRRGLEPGAVAYLLDGLVIVGIVLAFVTGASLFVAGMTSMASVVGGVINGERVGLLIVGMALALGLALALARAAGGRRAVQDSAGASAVVMPPIYPAVSAAESRLAPTVEQLGYAPPQERFEEPPMPLAMMQERWQPRVATAASVPTSFLDLAEPRARPQARSRFALASTLLTLALVVLLISGAVLFRRPLINVLAGMEASYGAADTGSRGSFGQADAGAENVAADVGAAAASVVSAPTAASLAAPLPVSDGQAAQKRVKSNGLNLRAQPGTDQQVVVVLTQGDIVTVFNDARLIEGVTWVKVRAGDFEGWVDQGLLE